MNMKKLKKRILKIYIQLAIFTVIITCIEFYLLHIVIEALM